MNTKLLSLRKGAGLTQSELAQKIGVTIQTISRWENGMSIPSPKRIKQMADLFNVDGSDIFLSSYTTKVDKYIN
ncbi:XRE family transcriptional regulator [Limosilactobacillus reuteri]|uniref:XRE family transcriptional regulator n=1 Tax=Limosilactobacillus reuteri TaxID=1598 RepID=A0A317GJ68_LIMRT|nr:helix-turn-helix transcriptional regulator [Limosilactobacillus reuteri]MCH5385349.1 helix-turn-helix domain-containing protein [Limosilactobacillus reuteri]PWT47894.1 XRE family transcriptional regulator [Limosilactobacillus reuteri]PWT52358.1 XRE family transcriptional regulator [Limosilactobacillus reuteri]PWT62988.1 XRE family transcriptional regulator [Limosilactobacillus reuteri]